jgi:hypothetical protein
MQLVASDYDTFFMYWGHLLKISTAINPNKNGKSAYFYWTEELFLNKQANKGCATEAVFYCTYHCI